MCGFMFSPGSIMAVVLGNQKPANLHLNYFQKIKNSRTHKSLILAYTVISYFLQPLKYIGNSSSVSAKMQDK